jgi:hypothetical protein
MAFDFPASPAIGQLYPASVAAGLPQYKWDGNAWIATGSVSNYVKTTGDTMTGPLVLNADPTAPLGAATKKYVDSVPVPDISGKVNRAGDTMTGALNSAGSGTQIQQAGPASSLQVLNSAGSSHAFMTFTAAGYFAGNFGIASDGNFYCGGLNFGAAAYKFWTARDFTAVPVSNGRLVFAADYTFTSGIVEPYGGAVLTSVYPGIDYQSQAIIVGRYRYMQLFTTGWFTVGYA